MARAPHVTSAVFDPRQRVGPDPELPGVLRLGGTPVPVVGTARVYVCGITPYDVTHLGHAATFVWADLLARVLGSTGVTTSVCRNVTDVDDVLLAAAADHGRYFDEFAASQEFLFERSMTALRVQRPAHEPRARQHVGSVQQLAQALLLAGAAYERDGWVRFRGAEAAARSGLGRDEALARAEAYGDAPDDPRKDDPFDVTVWQPSGPDEPAWPSPWGWGRPGWHAECAAMALSVHGGTVDVLAGGDDLAFPHHAHQAAMVEAATGTAPFARARFHVGTVRIGGARMAKSTGNLVLVDEVLGSTTSPVLRLVLLDRRHDEPWDFDHGVVDAAADRLDRLYAAAARTGRSDVRPLALLLDDLDVVGALDLAESAGGTAARDVIAFLGLA